MNTSNYRLQSPTIDCIAPEIWNAYRESCGAALTSLESGQAGSDAPDSLLHLDQLAPHHYKILETLSTLEAVHEYRGADVLQALLNIAQDCACRPLAQAYAPLPERCAELALRMLMCAGARDSVVALGRVLKAVPTHVRVGKLTSSADITLPTGAAMADLRQALESALACDDESAIGAVSLLRVPEKLVFPTAAGSETAWCFHVCMPSGQRISYLSGGDYRVNNANFGLIVCVMPKSRTYTTCLQHGPLSVDDDSLEYANALECILSACEPDAQQLLRKEAQGITLSPLTRDGWEKMFTKPVENKVHGIKEAALHLVTCARECHSGAYDVKYEARYNEDLAFISMQGSASEKLTLSSPTRAEMYFFLPGAPKEPVRVAMTPAAYHVDFRLFTSTSSLPKGRTALEVEAGVAIWLEMRGFIESLEEPQQSGIQPEGLKLALEGVGASPSMLKMACGRTLYAFLARENLLTAKECPAGSVLQDGVVCPVLISDDNEPYMVRPSSHRVHIPPPSEELKKLTIDRKALMKRIIDPQGDLGCEFPVSEFRNNPEVFKVTDINALGIRIYLSFNGTDTEFSHIHFHQAQDKELYGRSIVIITPTGQIPPAYTKDTKWFDRVVSMKVLLENAIDGGPDELKSPVTNFIGTGPRSNARGCLLVHPSLNLNQTEWSKVTIELTNNKRVHIDVKGVGLLNKPIDMISFTAPIGHGQISDRNSYMLLSTSALSGGVVKVSDGTDGKTLRKQMERLNAKMQMFFCLSERCYDAGEDGSYRFKFTITLDEALKKEREAELSKAKNESGATEIDKALEQKASEHGASSSAIAEHFGETLHGDTDDGSIPDNPRYGIRSLKGKKAQGLKMPVNGFQSPIEP